jgi:hypothetical protein
MKTLFSILLGAAGGFIATYFKSDPALLFKLSTGLLTARFDLTKS